MCAGKGLKNVLKFSPLCCVLCHKRLKKKLLLCILNVIAIGMAISCSGLKSDLSKKIFALHCQF